MFYLVGSIAIYFSIRFANKCGAVSGQNEKAGWNRG